MDSTLLGGIDREGALENLIEMTLQQDQTELGSLAWGERSDQLFGSFELVGKMRGRDFDGVGDALGLRGHCLWVVVPRENKMARRGKQMKCKKTRIGSEGLRQKTSCCRVLLDSV